MTSLNEGGIFKLDQHQQKKAEKDEDSPTIADVEKDKNGIWRESPTKKVKFKEKDNSKEIL